MNSLCVFCGSACGNNSLYGEHARELGSLMARRGIQLVYGGAQCGLMGMVADAVLEFGGRVIGVIPEILCQKEVVHPGLSELRVVGSMHERKALMASLSDGFIALPGGFGTLEEYCEIITWNQIGAQDKPCGLLNTLGYFDPLLAQVDRAIAEGFSPASTRHLMLSAAEPPDLLELVVRRASLGSSSGKGGAQ